MPTIDFPISRIGGRAPSSLVWSLQSNTLVHQSPLSGAVRTLSMPGARWRFTAQWPALSPVSLVSNGQHPAKAIEAFLAALNGRAGRFYFSPAPWISYEGPGTTNASTVSATVNGAGQTGSYLNATTTPSRQFLYGQFFEVNGELKRLTEVTASDGAGNVGYFFGPPLRSSPPNGATINFATPRSTFMLTDDNAGLSYRPGGLADFTLDAIEAFP